MTEPEFTQVIERLSAVQGTDGRSLSIRAAVAREIFDWPVSAEKSAARLRAALTDLRTVSIEDDYLDMRWMTAFEQSVQPVTVKWIQAMLSDGRHSK